MIVKKFPFNLKKEENRRFWKKNASTEIKTSGGQKKYFVRQNSTDKKHFLQKQQNRQISKKVLFKGKKEKERKVKKTTKQN